jgi:hypothetical protein
VPGNKDSVGCQAGIDLYPAEAGLDRCSIRSKRALAVTPDDSPAAPAVTAQLRSVYKKRRAQGATSVHRRARVRRVATRRRMHHEVACHRELPITNHR